LFRIAAMVAGFALLASCAVRPPEPADAVPAPSRPSPVFSHIEIGGGHDDERHPARTR
jgi:hypothetical protein